MARHCVSVSGLQSMVNKLNALGRDVDKIVDDSLHKSAYQVQKAAVNNIQSMSVSYNGHMYDARETGNLMRHISVEKLVYCQYGVGTNVEYAPYVEFGTGIAGDPSVPHTARTRWTYFDAATGAYRTAYSQPPRPFLRPAFNTTRSVVTQNMTIAITKAWSEGVGL